MYKKFIIANHIEANPMDAQNHANSEELSKPKKLISIEKMKGTTATNHINRVIEKTALLDMVESLGRNLIKEKRRTVRLMKIPFVVMRFVKKSLLIGSFGPR